MDFRLIKVTAVGWAKCALAAPAQARTCRPLPGDPEALFTRVAHHGYVTAQRIGPTAISRLVRARANAAGFDGFPVTGHPLRAGHATTAAMNGAPIDRIAAQTRHRDLGSLLNHYIRLAEALATSTGRDLGLRADNRSSSGVISFC